MGNTCSAKHNGQLLHCVTGMDVQNPSGCNRTSLFPLPFQRDAPACATATAGAPWIWTAGTVSVSWAGVGQAVIHLWKQRVVMERTTMEVGQLPVLFPSQNFCICLYYPEGQRWNAPLSKCDQLQHASFFHQHFWSEGHNGGDVHFGDFRSPEHVQVKELCLQI